jgi:uncharacterized membrane protein YeiH
VLLGMITAVGGGVMRDVLLNRIPVILEREIYASAALAGAGVVVLGKYFNWYSDWTFLAGFLLCSTLRILALYFHWKLPAFHKKIKSDKEN